MDDSSENEEDFIPGSPIVSSQKFLSSNTAAKLADKNKPIRYNSPPILDNDDDDDDGCTVIPASPDIKPDIGPYVSNDDSSSSKNNKRKSSDEEEDSSVKQDDSTSEDYIQPPTKRRVVCQRKLVLMSDSESDQESDGDTENEGFLLLTNLLVDNGITLYL